MRRSREEEESNVSAANCSAVYSIKIKKSFIIYFILIF